jgi:hypothetical protein
MLDGKAGGGEARKIREIYGQNSGANLVMDEN